MGTAVEKRQIPGDPSSGGQEDEDVEEDGNKSGLGGVEKRPFLRKGSGLSRFYKGKPPKRYFKQRKSQGETSNGDSSEVCSKSEDHEAEPENAKENNPQVKEDDEDELRLFEDLEKATEAASFCSSSSLAAHFLRTKLLAANKRDSEALTLNGKNGDAYSPSSSLFGSEDDDDVDDDDEDEDDCEELSQHMLPQVVAHHASSATSSQKIDITIPKALPLSLNRSNDIRMLEEENTCLKARLVYLEEKMEKNTLEWWSFKEKMVNIIQGLQNSISRRDAQMESMQNALTKKIEALGDDIRSRGQKWGESHVEMVEKTHLLEEEVHILNDKVNSMKTKVLKRIDDVEAEVRNTALEFSTNQDSLEKRVGGVERDRRSHSKLKESATSPMVSNAVEPIKETVDDSVFGKDSEEDGEDGVTKILPNGDKETVYPNGTKKIVAHDLSEMRHLYTNGDVRITKRDGTVKYFYVDSGTWHTTYTNGVEYFEFANGQVERRNPNGVVEVVFTNGCVKYSHPTGTEECIFADNTILRVEPTGERSVVLPNGQKEVYRQDYKKRVYPDGTTKIVYMDGTQETRYPNGRVRIKGGDGSLIADVVDNKNKAKAVKQSAFKIT